MSSFIGDFFLHIPALTFLTFYSLRPTTSLFLSAITSILTAISFLLKGSKAYLSITGSREYFKRKTPKTIKPVWRKNNIKRFHNDAFSTPVWKLPKWLVFPLYIRPASSKSRKRLLRLRILITKMAKSPGGSSTLVRETAHAHSRLPHFFRHRFSASESNSSAIRPNYFSTASIKFKITCLLSFIVDFFLCVTQPFVPRQSGTGFSLWIIKLLYPSLLS